MITKQDERGRKLEPYEDAIIEVPEEHMGQVPAALSHSCPCCSPEAVAGAVVHTNLQTADVQQLMQFVGITRRICVACPWAALLPVQVRVLMGMRRVHAGHAAWSMRGRAAAASRPPPRCPGLCWVGEARLPAQVVELMGTRKGQMQGMAGGMEGGSRVTYTIPTRGLLGAAPTLCSRALALAHML